MVNSLTVRVLLLHDVLFPLYQVSAVNGAATNAMPLPRPCEKQQQTSVVRPYTSCPGKAPPTHIMYVSYVLVQVCYNMR